MWACVCVLGRDTKDNSLPLWDERSISEEIEKQKEEMEMEEEISILCCGNLEQKNNK